MGAVRTKFQGPEIRRTFFFSKCMEAMGKLRGEVFFRPSSSCHFPVPGEYFGVANGAHSELELRNRISRYRQGNADLRDFQIGCRLLTQPFFLEEEDWISLPKSWSRSIVQFKVYDTDEREGRDLYDRVILLLKQDPLFPGEAASRFRQSETHYTASWTGGISSSDHRNLRGVLCRNEGEDAARAGSRSYPSL